MPSVAAPTDHHYRYIFERGLNTILDDIRDDLREFGVVYDEWYSERTLAECGAVNRTINRLRDAGYVYEQDGALWFRSSAFGDEKDRVVERENGQTTYFASDIAYHLDKFERGFDRVIDVWGADHHGYVPRVKAALRAMGENPDKLDVLLVQFAILYRNGERVQMSTRSGEFVTLRELRQEVGNDAARFFYVMRKSEQHLDFDLDLAKSQSRDNPVYYIQYVHARVSSVLRQLGDKGLSRDEARGRASLTWLTEPHEEALLVALSRYPDVVESAALAHEPHQLAHYLREPGYTASHQKWSEAVGRLGPGGYVSIRHDYKSAATGQRRQRARRYGLLVMILVLIGLFGGLLAYIRGDRTPSPPGAAASAPTTPAQPPAAPPPPKTVAVSPAEPEPVKPKYDFYTELPKRKIAIQRETVKPGNASRPAPTRIQPAANPLQKPAAPRRNAASTSPTMATASGAKPDSKTANSKTANSKTANSKTANSKT
ncbi:MAG: Arginine--tRNA ligase, partial [Proteobacteria bacterium]|nr:Arginine--tRNA ligase [Pseudomonadota bacterium]